MVNKQMRLLWIFLAFCGASLVVIKPDIMERQLLWHALKDLNKFQIKSIKPFIWTPALIEEVYEAHLNKSYFQELSDSLQGKYSVAITLSSPIALAREYTVKVLRPRYAMDVTKNSFHASDSLVAFERELKLLEIQ